MDIQQLDKDRFLQKNPQQTDATKNAVYTSINPVPKKGAGQNRKWGQANDSQEDSGAPNILTGTVIVACFIQTSALPSRIELQGNDLTFFDDTYEQNGKVIGDTSRLIFTHGSGKKGEVITAGFIMEKRASIYNTYDNVLSWYSPPAPTGAHNYMFIGYNATSQDPERNISSIHFAVDGRSDFQQINGNSTLDGVWEVQYSLDGAGVSRLVYTGKSESMFPGAGVTGYSSLIIAGQGGLVGFGYTPTAGGLIVGLYMISETSIQVGLNMIPDTASMYDLGSTAFPFRNIYASGGISMGGGLTWSKGVGSPEGVVTAPVGSLYSNTSGGASTTLYVKTSGTGNTGWTAK